MAKVSIRLTDELHARMKCRVAQTGESLSEFVRGAVVEQLAAVPAEETPYAAWLRLSRDCVDSGETDRSTTYKARIKRQFRAKHRG